MDLGLETKKQGISIIEQVLQNKEAASEATDTVDEKLVDELLTACEGAVCEVLTTDNYLFFAGRITQRDPDFRTITVEPRGNEEAPLGVGRDTAIKVQARVKTEWGNLVMIYGTVSLCEEDQWKIFVDHAVACKESRRAFRQRVEGEAQLFWVPGFRFRGKCQLEDISLVGIAFYSPLKLDVGRQLILEIPNLVEDGPSYRFSCTVAVGQNIAEITQSPRWRYGCSFESLDEEVESMLYRDIMALQVQGRKS